jgi:rhodanese-related sulfurtransferase
MERIDPETLRDWLENPEIYILDVRSPQAWEASRVKTPGAHHFDPHQPVETWAPNIPKDKKLVAY